MPISRVFVVRFFQLVTKRRFAEAERILERIKLKVQETEWNKGYFQALNGILLAQKSNDDQYAFLPNLDLDDEDELKKYRREFLKQARKKIHADYDRGFFTAWADYMRVSIRMRENPGVSK
jgi:ATP/maltotriose-dependent transcriptional regulator MalT